MSDDLQLESFAAWLLALQIGSAIGAPGGPPPVTMKVAATELARKGLVTYTVTSIR